MKFNCSLVAMALVVLFCIFGTTFGASFREFFPYGLELDTSFDIADDSSSGKVELDTPVVFFASRKYNLYISTNGLVSFDEPIPDYKGDLFPIGSEVIAPFYADIDTRSSGEIFYRETKEADVLEQAALDINRAFKPRPGRGRFEPKSLFIVTWANVGSYSQQFEKVNTFQLVLANSGFDTYVMFLYMDGYMQWVQADLKDNVPEVAAQAGFDSGSTNFPPFALPGSGFPEAADWNV